MSPPPVPRSEKQISEGKELYAKHIAQTWGDQQASSDAFDNNLLTFSSAALGLSLTFIKDVVPLESAEWLKVLYASWIAFACCILVTIISFQIANQAQRVHAVTLRAYYLEGNEEAIKRKDPWALALPWCAAIGTVCLFTGVVCTLCFASKNMTHFKEMKRWQKTPPTKQASLLATCMKAGSRSS